VEPEIPQNTGNIARTCGAVGAELHLVKPLGFSLEDRYLKRAGLDYWDMLSIHTYKNLDAFLPVIEKAPFVLVSKKAGIAHTSISYDEECYLLFGKETKGLPEDLLAAHPSRCVRIPMKQGARSLNLSNAVAVIVYEALRQQGFSGLKRSFSGN
jgi:tRNA (cytidine/uridine-2'-O-)-methyltransferase